MVADTPTLLNQPHAATAVLEHVVGNRPFGRKTPGSPWGAARAAQSASEENDVEEP